MADETRRKLLAGVFMYLRREYTTFQMRTMPWPKIVKDIEKTYNTTFTAEEFAVLLFFIADEETKEHKQYLEFLRDNPGMNWTNRT